MAIIEDLIEEISDISKEWDTVEEVLEILEWVLVRTTDAFSF